MVVLQIRWYSCLECHWTVLFQRRSLSSVRCCSLNYCFWYQKRNLQDCCSDLLCDQSHQLRNVFHQNWPTQINWPCNRGFFDLSREKLKVHQRLAVISWCCFRNNRIYYYSFSLPECPTPFQARLGNFPKLLSHLELMGPFGQPDWLSVWPISAIWRS